MLSNLEVVVLVVLVFFGVFLFVTGVDPLKRVYSAILRAKRILFSKTE